MKFEYVIRDELGLHARPASELSKTASRFQSECSVAKGDKTANLKRIIGIMLLAAKKGETLTFSFAGDDEQAACETIRLYCEKSL